MPLCIGNAHQPNVVGCQPVCAACGANIPNDGTPNASSANTAQAQSLTRHLDDMLDKRIHLNLLWPSLRQGA
jgi:hypothetical protein|tara:strand:- start:135 stop:350 length:216 start_codon:yes stop_codon:yes gene_type:complete